MSENVKVDIKDYLNNFEGNKKSRDFNEAKNYLKPIMVDNYVPFLQKKVVLTALVNNSVVNNGAGFITYLDDTMITVNMFSAVLLLYSKFDVESFTQDHSAYDLYDLFASQGLVDVIYDLINQNELIELQKILNTLKKTWEQNNRSVEAVISKYLGMMSKWVNANLDSLQNVIDILKEE